MALTLSEVIKRSAAAVAAAESIQVESARMLVIPVPPINDPLAFTSAMANSAPAAMAGVRDSIGPVKPKIIPILTSSAIAAPESIAPLTRAKNTFLIGFLLVLFINQAGWGSN
jgi:hypothetical protein